MSERPRYEVVTTSGGQRAMYDRAVGEIMHPVVGPAAEALALYVGPSRLRERLAEPENAPLVVLDVGLGAASNAVAAWRAAELAEGSRALRIISFEHTLAPLHAALADECADDFGLAGVMGQRARVLMEKKRVESQRVTWELILGDLPETLREVKDASVDVVFWDPYSPVSNPELWTFGTFRKLHSLCRVGATVHTYSSATKIRAALVLAGFFVGAGPAIGTKPHTTMAAMEMERLDEPMSQRWLERFLRSSAPLPDDAPPDAMARVQRSPQFLIDKERGDDPR